MVVFGVFILALLSASDLLVSVRDSVGPSTFDPLFSLLLVCLILATAFSAEAPRLGGSKEIAFISMIVALGAAGRVLFVAAPNVSPVDWLTLCAGLVFGPATGFTVGSTIMLVSNFWLGQGPWTLYQMVSMGSLGVLGGCLRPLRKRLGAKALAAIGFVWGFVYGVAMSVFWMLMVSSVLSWTSFVAYWLAGLPFYVLQGVGNAVLLFILGPRTVTMLHRFDRRLRVSFDQGDPSGRRLG